MSKINIVLEDYNAHELLIALDELSKKDQMTILDRTTSISTRYIAENHKRTIDMLKDEVYKAVSQGRPAE